MRCESWAACVLLTLVCHADELGWRPVTVTAQVPSLSCGPSTHAACRCAYQHPLGLPRAYRHLAQLRPTGPRGPPRARTSCSRLREHAEHTRPRASAAAAGLPHPFGSADKYAALPARNSRPDTRATLGATTRAARAAPAVSGSTTVR